MAVNPASTLAYVTDGTGNVTVIDTATDTITVGNAPTGVTVNPSGTDGYVTNQSDNTVSVLDLTATPPAATITVPVGASPNYVAVDPSGASAYVTDGGDAAVTVLERCRCRTPVSTGRSAGSASTSPSSG